MYLGQRVIYETLDLSKELNDWRTGSKVLAYETDKYLYVGSDVPFNNLYFDLGTNKNIVAANVHVELWWGNAWTEAVDVIDETMVGEASLGKSGRISFRPGYNSGWTSLPRTENLFVLSTFQIYNYYWARFSWDADLSVNTEIKSIGQKFSEDGDLFIFYPDLNNLKLMAAHAAGKTDWNPQHFAASEFIIRSLISKNIMWSRGQILDSNKFVEAAVHKTAEIIYGSFGQAYVNNKKAANDAYKSAINMGRFAIDLDGEAALNSDTRYSHTMFQGR